MNRTVSIELYETHESVNFYTLKFKNDEDTEIDKFFNLFPAGCPYDEDIDILIKWIDKIAEKGSLERYFRPEGKIHDNIYAIPIEKSNLRLYVIRINDGIVILGNGGLKNTHTYNENPELNSIVELLQEVSYHINSRIKETKITIYQNQIYGNKDFYLKNQINEK